MINTNALIDWAGEPDRKDDPLGYFELRCADLWADGEVIDLIQSLDCVGMKKVPVPVWAPRSVGRWMHTFAPPEAAEEYQRILERAAAAVGDVPRPDTIDRRSWIEALWAAAHAISSVLGAQARYMLEQADFDEETEKAVAETLRDVTAFEMLSILALMQSGLRLGDGANGR